jgi:hypothetical protein
MSSRPTLLSSCCALAVACASPGGESADAPSPESITLTRAEDGDLLLCSDEGECAEIDYGGECASVTLTLDRASDEICQSCELANGDVVDQGCDTADDACIPPEVRDSACVEFRASGEGDSDACDGDNEEACIPLADLAGGPGWFRN